MLQLKPSKHQQKGAAAIEFSLFFILLFILFYGLVSFFMPFLLKNHYEQIASNLVKEAIATPGSELGSLSEEKHAELEKKIQARATQYVKQSALPDHWKQPCQGYGNNYIKKDGQSYSACVAHPSADKLMPSLKLPLFKDATGKQQWISLPDIPKELRGEAIILR